MRWNYHSTPTNQLDQTQGRKSRPWKSWREIVPLTYQISVPGQEEVDHDSDKRTDKTHSLRYTITLSPPTAGTGKPRCSVHFHVFRYRLDTRWGVSCYQAASPSSITTTSTTHHHPHQQRQPNPYHSLPSITSTLTMHPTT